MENQLISLNIPVPPAPILERAVGYRNERNARYLALWWEPCGDEAMVSDGFVTFTGHWPGYLAYVHHSTVYPHLAAYNLGSSDEPAEYRLMIDLQERRASIATCRQAEVLLSAQWQRVVAQVAPVTLSLDDLEGLLADFLEQTQPLVTVDELMRRMEEDRQAVETLRQWLDQSTNSEGLQGESHNDQQSDR